MWDVGYVGFLHLDSKKRCERLHLWFNFPEASRLKLSNLFDDDMLKLNVTHQKSMKRRVDAVAAPCMLQVSLLEPNKV